jgi:hypothetical protein
MHMIVGMYGALLCWILVIQQSSPGQLDLTGLWSQLPLAAYLLLFVAAGLLVSDISKRQRYLLVALTVALAGALLYSSGLLNAPGMLAGAATLFVPLVLVGGGAGLAFVLLKRGRGMLALVCLVVASVFLVQQVIVFGGRGSLLDYPYQGTGLAVLVPLIGGVLLALSIAAGHKQRTWYIAIGLLVAGTVGLGAYLNLMEGITYAFVAPDRMFGPYADVRTTQATTEAITATLIYVVGSLIMLALPFGSERQLANGNPHHPPLKQAAESGAR